MVKIVTFRLKPHVKFVDFFDNMLNMIDYTRERKQS
jgi:hypothetical protein